MARLRKKTSVSFDALTVEGGLITSAMLASVTAREAGHQKEEDYSIPKGLTLRDEIARYFRIGQALYRELTASPTPSEAATIHFTEALLRDTFGFSDIKRIGQKTINDRLYAVTLEALEGRVPVVVVPPADDLDRVSAGLPTDGRKRSASSAIQDWLNANEDALWGLCCNGEKIRLARDNASFTRPAYIEANLRQIFEAENFADFTTLWLLIHSSRFGVKDSVVSDCSLERWREAGGKEGLAARERLRDGVESALLALGNGFLAHPQNNDLKTRLENGELPLPDYFSQLLRLVYRLIFLLVAEDRLLLHPPAAAAPVRKLYADGYSLACLRNHCTRRSAWDRYHDRWEGLNITFAALTNGEPRLGLPALSGLFSVGVIPDLETAHLSNRSLMEAVYRLAWLKESSGLVSVNWRDMETEELGSVYESLLELTPRLIDHGRTFSFAEGAETKGNTRKTSGSYYTPDSLVQTLLDSALDPVLDRVEAEASDPAAALLAVTAIDPACGSGHFLLAAARRIASRVARARAGGVASAEDYRHALRDVARNCIYGVDRNPMAVELTKVALWIETVEPGKPLGFLDANIRCGDSLLGVFDLEVLRKGIPDEAYKPLTGDDKETSKYFEKINKADKGGQGSLDFLGGGGNLPAPPPLASTVRNIRALPEDSVKDIAEKKRVFEASKSDPRLWTWRVAADLYVAAFLVPKTGGIPANKNSVTIPTTSQVWQQISGKQSYGPLVGRGQDIAIQARAFHWPLEFPDIMVNGGFDVVLGNPPWERIKLQEQEFFSSRDPEIANAPTAAARKRKIAVIKESRQGTREALLYQEFETACRLAEAASIFARHSGRFPLTGTGDLNTYALFAEHFKNLAGRKGRAGIIVPTGLITDFATSAFFSDLISNNKIIRSYAFDNQKKIFPGIHSDTPFTLLTMGACSGNPEFSAYILLSEHLNDANRRYFLSAEDITRINPNTKTAPVFRSKADADLTAKIYNRIPVLVKQDNKETGNPWGISFLRLFDMSNDSNLFYTQKQLIEESFVCNEGVWVKGKLRYIPLYEAKMMHQFDHRWATCEGLGETSRDVTLAEKIDPGFEPLPRYWVQEREVKDRLSAKGYNFLWLMGIRGITNATNERTLISSIWPYSAAGNSIHVWVVDPSIRPQQIAALYGCSCSLILDYIARQKVGGTNLNFFYVEQFPILPPSAYKEEDLSFITPRVLELSYTSHAMAPFAHDLGFKGKPFIWNEDRRAILRAELDAWYARAYGLTRDELRYVLDPADVKGSEYPSETFRVLKEKEIKEFGEYRTRRLVLEAWDRLTTGELAAA